MTTRFRDELAFLSNFYPVKVQFEGAAYPNVEAAFQAAKCAEVKEREKFRTLPGVEAKALGRQIAMRRDWESVKLKVLYELVKGKFENDAELKQLLLDTGDKLLVEGNTWHDNFYGDCICGRPSCAKTGKNHLGQILMRVREELIPRCPICHSKESFKVLNEKSGLHYCFDCGNAVQPEHSELSIIGNHEPPTVQHSLLKEICGQAAVYFNLRGRENDEARAYLFKRGISEEAICDFQIGYAPQTEHGLVDCLTESGFTGEDIFAAGLATLDKGTLKDYLHNRLVFPLRNASGDVVAFSGRLMHDSKTSPKYLNTHTSQIYARNTILFNLDKAKYTKQDYLILVEGYADAISLSMSGYDNVIASMGTELSTVQSALLANHTKEVVVMYDGDKPGVRAMYKAVKTLTDLGINVAGVLLPDKHDPDSYVREYGEESLSGKIKQARGSLTLPVSGEGSIDKTIVLTDFIRRQEKGNAPGAL
jgi:ribA/ribD-fused uncharacterized protein